jgi:hypothetical protein
LLVGPVVGALSVMVLPAVTPPVPMVIGLCAVILTVPFGAFTELVVVIAPVLSTVILPLAAVRVPTVRGTILVKSMFPEPVTAALKLFKLTPVTEIPLSAERLAESADKVKLELENDMLLYVLVYENDPTLTELALKLCPKLNEALPLEPLTPPP